MPKLNALKKVSENRHFNDVYAAMISVKNLSKVF